jgi:hypothetical protein
MRQTSRISSQTVNLAACGQNKPASAESNNMPMQLAHPTGYAAQLILAARDNNARVE